MSHTRAQPFLSLIHTCFLLVSSCASSPLALVALHRPSLKEMSEEERGGCEVKCEEPALPFKAHVWVAESQPHPGGCYRELYHSAVLTLTPFSLGL